MSINAATLREKQKEDLAKELTGLWRKRLKLSMAKASKELTKTHELKLVRRNIARILTIMQQQAEGKPL